MNPIRFKSILNHGSIGYEFTNDSMTFWDQSYRYGNVIHCSMGYFETYGDGATQHTPLMPCTKEHFTDYCVSLVRHMLSNPTEELQTYLFGLEKCNAETIKFLAGIKFRDDKRQWFSIGDKKVSSSDSKKYDTRWTEVKRDADGTICSAINLFLDQSKGEPRELFNRYAVIQLFWDTLYSLVPHGDFEKLTEFKKTIPGDHHSAFRAVDALVRGFALLDQSRRACECAEHNTKNEAITA